MSYPTSAIANYFLDQSKGSGVPVSPMKLQKLVYFAHGWYLALVGRALINETIQAWNYGPVIQSLYNEFRHFGNAPITSYAGEPNPPRVPEADTETKTILDKVWQVYGRMTAFQLSNLTHGEGTPWTYPTSMFEPIDDSTIKAHFLEKSRQ